MAWWLVGVVFYGMAGMIIYCLIIEAIGEKPQPQSADDEPLGSDNPAP